MNTVEKIATLKGIKIVARMQQLFSDTYIGTEPLLNVKFSGGEGLPIVQKETNKVSCMGFTAHDYTGDYPDDWENCEKVIKGYRFLWLFPNKTKWVVLGTERSYELLRQHGGTIPQWLEDAVKGYPTKGDGWNLIN